MNDFAENADWSRYTPRTAPDYLTLWELSLQMVDFYKLDYPFDTTDPEELAHAYALPELVRWIFTEKGTRGDIDFSKAEWKVFISRFLMEFFNNKISYLNPSVWRMKIMGEIYNVRFALESAAQPLYSQILESSAELSQSRDTTSTNDTTRTEQKSTDTSTKQTGTDSRTTERTGKNQADTTEDTTGTTTGNSRLSGTDTSENSSQGTTTKTGNSRMLQSDMPQSIVNQDTVGNPELQSWKYASGMQDNFQSDKTTDTRTDNSNKQSESSSSDTTESNNHRTANQTENRTENGTDTSTVDRTTTGKDTVSGDSSENFQGTTHETSKSDSLSAYELARQRYDFFIDRLSEPVQMLVNKFYVYFCSDYTDEEKMGFLKWGEPLALAESIYKGE